MIKISYFIGWIIACLFFYGSCYADTEPQIARIIIYNSLFAKRFGLDLTKAQALSPGLYAIEMTLNKIPRESDSPNILAYDCYLNLYVDSNLKIHYPEGGQFGNFPGDATIVRLVSAPIRKIGVKDGESLMTYFYRFGNYPIGLIDHPINKPYFDDEGTGWGTLDSYARNIFPGISFIRSDTGCDVSSAVNGDNAYLLLQKQNQSTQIKVNGKWYYSKNAFYIFNFPREIVNWSYARYGECVNNYNAALDMHKTFIDLPVPKACKPPIDL